MPQLHKIYLNQNLYRTSMPNINTITAEMESNPWTILATLPNNIYDTSKVLIQFIGCYVDSMFHHFYCQFIFTLNDIPVIDTLEPIVGYSKHVYYINMTNGSLKHQLSYLTSYEKRTFTTLEGGNVYPFIYNNQLMISAIGQCQNGLQLYKIMTVNYPGYIDTIFMS